MKNDVIVSLLAIGKESLRTPRELVALVDGIDYSNEYSRKPSEKGRCDFYLARQSDASAFAKQQIEKPARQN